MFCIIVYREKKTALNDSSSRLSCEDLNLILERIKTLKYTESTKKMYQIVWRKFNHFLLMLDYIPKEWETRMSLFSAHLFEQGIQSATLKSYYFMIKSTLVDDGYRWSDDKVILHTLTRVCKRQNDRLTTRLPIHKKLLEVLLFELERVFSDQPFLETMYKAFFLIAYYGMFRVGELATGSHPVRAKDVHIAQNKDKIMFILYTSKTHNKAMRPQKIKISALEQHSSRYFCPFKASREYLAIRGNYRNDSDPFFIYRDQTPVTPQHVHSVLRKTLSALNLNHKLYNMHSIKIGRTSDMLNYGYSVEQIRLVGHWRSNAVYNYIRTNIKYV